MFSRLNTIICLPQALLYSVREMTHFVLDIIIPVWNNPADTRNCLASLVEHSPGARFILMDNGSNRETESLLQVFAEHLNERALLLRSEVTREFIKVVNSGLARTEAPVAAVVKNTSIVTAGWMEPILEAVTERPDIGVAIPNLVEKKAKLPVRGKIAVKSPIEISHGSFAALMVTKSLYQKIGGFDEGLDGRLLCLKDYSRRAWQQGFVTVAVAGAPVYFSEEVLFGSPARRKAIEQRSAALFSGRWGKERTYCIEMNEEANPDNFDRKFAMLLRGARSGRHITILAHPKAYRAIVAGGFNLLHTNIIVEPLPALFTTRSIANHLSRLREQSPDIRILENSDWLPPIGEDEDDLPEAEIID
jgi:hypothetical protein